MNETTKTISLLNNKEGEVASTKPCQFCKSPDALLVNAIPYEGGALILPTPVSACTSCLDSIYDKIDEERRLANAIDLWREGSL